LLDTFPALIAQMVDGEDVSGFVDTEGARVVQEKAIVVVFVAETRVIPPGVLCALPGYGDHLSVKLTKPIGSRVLVDGVSASAVPV
jgi:hypothetical protein